MSGENVSDFLQVPKTPGKSAEVEPKWRKLLLWTKGQLVINLMRGVSFELPQQGYHAVLIEVMVVFQIFYIIPYPPSQMTYVDIAVFHILRATEFQFKDAYNDTDALDIPCLRGFKERMEALPNIAQYLASDRCHKFCGNSMM